MNGFKLRGTGRALPSKALSNQDMCQFVDTSDEWIVSRTGIRQRYFCGEGENTVTLTCEAARKALENSGVSAQEIGCLLVACSSAEYVFPSNACLAHAALGLPEDIPVLEMASACTGFLYAMETARGLLMAQGRRYALLVGVEQMSSLLDMNDRSVCVLFGDGAGAAVFEFDPEGEYYSVQGTSGDPIISCGGPRHMEPLVMGGQTVFRFATTVLPKMVSQLMEKGGVTMDEVDWVICHQANERILDASIRRLGAPAEKFYKNLEHYGNMSAASIPFCMDEMREKGLLKPGQRVILVSFGAGLSWAGAMMTV